MFSRTRSVCCWWGAGGEVVEIVEGIGVRRAKVIAAGELVEIAPLGSGEVHLGDRIDLAWPERVTVGEPQTPFEYSGSVDTDQDPRPEW
jgi:hypothetical protein